jgi:hypothetical protein
MNIERRATKLYLKDLPPVEAYRRIDEYKIPSPYREVLFAVINRKEGFSGCDYLSENFHINMSYWTFGRRLKEALDMFRKSNSIYNR